MIKPPITANKRVDFRRQNAIATGDIRSATHIDNEPIMPGIGTKNKTISAKQFDFIVIEIFFLRDENKIQKVFVIHVCRKKTILDKLIDLPASRRF